MIVLGVCVGKCGLFFEKKRGENTREKRGGGATGEPADGGVWLFCVES